MRKLTPIISIYTTFPSVEVAHSICQQLIEHHYIACANIFPTKSIYMWQEVIHNQPEFAAFLKTSQKSVERAIEKLQELHPYDTPCIVIKEEKASYSYGLWVMQECSNSNL